MESSLGPLEELHAVLDTFIEEKERFVFLLTTGDDELSLVVPLIEQMDESSPSDVYFIDVSPVRDLVTYVNAVVAHARAELDEVNQAREQEGREPIAALPDECQQKNVPPLDRLRCLISHMTSWVSDADGQRMVIALVPSHISDRPAHAKIVGALAPLQGRPPWSRALRLILRDDRHEPFVEEILRKLGATGIYLYTTRLTIRELADVAAADVANKDLSAPRRINALMQCAIFDTALGRYEAAIDKYRTLFQYYDEHGVTEMKSTVLQGTGDILGRIKRYPGARDKYLQALDLASDAKSLQLILNCVIPLGDIDMRLDRYVEAEHVYALGAEAAEKMGNVYAQADLLEKCGLAREALKNHRGATECFTAAANAAREFSYDARLATVLPRLCKIYKRIGDDDLRKSYNAELRAVRARLSER
ncbi:MAG: hypothetical protein FWD73_17830 [Polyangiaceae bacterium]|nr:hypothetical protein [Polyangiaceae bacterium]